MEGRADISGGVCLCLWRGGLIFLYVLWRGGLKFLEGRADIS